MVENINQMWLGTVHFWEFSDSEMQLRQCMDHMRAADTTMLDYLQGGLNPPPSILYVYKSFIKVWLG